MTVAALTLGVLASLALPTNSLADDPSISRKLSRGMATFVSELDADQLDEAEYAFSDDERFDLKPARLGLEGLRVSEMSDVQWLALEKLLGTVVIVEGLAKVNIIGSLEHEVAETEGGLFGFLFDRIRDPKRYFLSIFGKPATETPWVM